MGDGVIVDTAPVFDGAVDAMSASCPPGYVTIGTLPSRYRIDSVGVDWAAAEVECDADGVGTHLVVAATQLESDQIADAITGGSHWIGVTDRTLEGTFRPITPGSWYANWASGEPGGDSGDCVVLKPADDGGGNPQPRKHEEITCASATYNKPFVCECDGVEPDPGAF